MESYVRLFWQGDTPAWQGLLRNYICSLYQAISLNLVNGNKNVLFRKTIIVDLRAYDNIPLGDVLKNIGRKFLNVNQVQWLTKFYGENNIKCGTKELTVILRLTHELAFKLCIEDMCEREFITEMDRDRLLFLLGDHPESNIDRLRTDGTEKFEEKLLQKDESLRRKWFAEMEDIMEDAFLQNIIRIRPSVQSDEFLYKDSTGVKGNRLRNWLSIRNNYPQIYVDQLKDMIYPETYVVCFSDINDNSAMWGNYANKHTGVCLIYESDELMVRHNEVFSDLDENIVRPANFGKLKISQVEYGGNLVERNFFETLGRLTAVQLKSWLTGAEKTSKIYNKYIENKDSWRENYWNENELSRCRKLDSWAYEREYRICIDNSLGTYNTSDKRNIEYTPNALKGLIFGMKTSEFDMKRIFDAIPIECWGGDKDFEFYQAEYDDETMEFYIRKILMFVRRDIS